MNRNGNKAESVGGNFVASDDSRLFFEVPNSLLIVTFDENDDQGGYYGLTNPLIGPNPRYSPRYNRLLRDIQNRIVTIFAGAHIKPGSYAEGKGITHVNILRTIEAMYGLPKSGAQQPNAAGGGIADETIITDVFESVR